MVAYIAAQGEGPCWIGTSNIHSADIYDSMSARWVLPMTALCIAQSNYTEATQLGTILHMRYIWSNVTPLGTTSERKQHATSFDVLPETIASGKSRRRCQNRDQH